MAVANGKTGWRAAPPTVWALGLVSLLTDASSELIHGLLPLFLVVVLGASPTALGVIEGVAEATASVVKVFSGWLSDKLGKRKALALAGYGLAMLCKPLFPIATSVNQVLFARFLDRVGKGIRGAPRDALMADVTPPEIRGAAFGLRQALDTIGAIIGPLLAVGLMALLANDIRKAMWWAVLPAAAAVLALALLVKEPPQHAVERRGLPVRLSALGRMGPAYWLVIAVAVIFHLARFSEAFLILKARDVGLSLGFAPIVMAVMSIVYALVSTPAGELSDRAGRRVVLAAGLLALVAADVTLASARTISMALLGAALWGLHMGLSQGLLQALVADSTPAQLRGTGFGIFGLTTGVAVLVASILAGALWQNIGPTATFGAGAVFALLSFSGLWLIRTKAPAG